MSVFLPLFPLELVVFQKENLNLHIFEDKYKELISECFNQTKSFGIPFYIKKDLKEYGMEMEVTKIEKVYADGKMDIRTKGIRLFRLIEYLPKVESKLYPGGIVDFNHHYVHPENGDTADEKVEEKFIQILKEISSILEIEKSLVPKTSYNMSYKVAHYLGLSIEDEYTLTLMTNETNRQLFLIQYLRSILPQIEKKEIMKKKIQLNGHFKELNPPL